MTRSSSPDKYPAAFHALLDKVMREGEVMIPHEHPTSFKGYLQSFLFAVEHTPLHPKSELVKNLMVRKNPDGTGVIICDRDRSPAAKAVLAILGDNAPETMARDAENSFLADLGVRK